MAPQVAVADFGFARLRAKSEQGGFSSSKTGPVRWEAPESLRLKQYSEATDAFMFGVCMWEMVAGRVPWAPLSTGDEFEQHAVRLAATSKTMCIAAAAHAVLSGERLKIPKNCDYQLGQLILQCWCKLATRAPSMANPILFTRRLEDPTARPKLSDAYEALRRRSHELMEEVTLPEPLYRPLSNPRPRTAAGPNRRRGGRRRARLGAGSAPAKGPSARLPSVK